MVFSGLGVGALWKALSWIFNLFRTEIGYSMPRTQPVPERHAERRRLAGVPRRRATSSARASPGTMFAGGVLSWLVLLPLLSILGSYITEPFPPIHPNFANNPATGRPS